MSDIEVRFNVERLSHEVVIDGKPAIAIKALEANGVKYTCASPMSDEGLEILSKNRGERMRTAALKTFVSDPVFERDGQVSFRSEF